MKVSVVNKSDVSRTLQIEVPSETVAAEYEKAFAKAAAGAALPGFRKGKVPRAILEPRVRSSVNQEVLEALLPQATYDAVQKEALKAVGRPRIGELKFEGVGPLSFEATVDIKPEFSLGAIEGLQLSAPAAAVSEKEVDEQVEGLRQRQGQPGEAREAAANGDWILVDFQGFIDGQPFKGGNAEGFSMVLGKGQLIPGFEDQLLGAKAAEVRQVKVKFPDDYPGRDVAGKNAEFTVAVKEIKALVLPAADDAWAKTLGEEVTDLGFLRERLREGLAEQKKRFREARLMDSAADALLDRHKFAVPETLIEAEAEAMERSELRRMQAQGMELNGEEGHAAMHKALREPAEKRARLGLVLEKVAELNKVEVSGEDYDAEMGRLGVQIGTSAAEAAKWARQSGREDAVKAQIRERKALEWVIAKAKVTEVA